MATGRPCKLTGPDGLTIQTRICSALSIGMAYEHAAQYGGIHYNTFTNWRARGQKELDRRDSPRVKPGTKKWVQEQPFLEFLEAIKKAEADGNVRRMALINKAAEDDWKAAAWIQERRYPEHYGRHSVDVTSGGEALAPITADDFVGFFHTALQELGQWRQERGIDGDSDGDDSDDPAA